MIVMKMMMKINKRIQMNTKVNLMMIINKVMKMDQIQEVIFKVQIHQIAGFKFLNIQILMLYRLHKIMQRKVLNHPKIIVYRINLRK
jgi:hypothetical protein